MFLSKIGIFFSKDYRFLDVLLWLAAVTALALGLAISLLSCPGLDPISGIWALGVSVICFYVLAVRHFERSSRCVICKCPNGNPVNLFRNVDTRLCSRCKADVGKIFDEKAKHYVENKAFHEGRGFSTNHLAEIYLEECVEAKPIHRFKTPSGYEMASSITVETVSVTNAPAEDQPSAQPTTTEVESAVEAESVVEAEPEVAVEDDNSLAQ